MSVFSNRVGLLGIVTFGTFLTFDPTPLMGAQIRQPVKNGRPPTRSGKTGQRDVVTGPRAIASEIKSLGALSFEVVSKGNSTRRYLFIHGDEYAARDVIRSYIEDHSGVAYIIQGRRRLQHWRGWLLDPNRMFSREGGARNLRLLNRDITSAGLTAALGALESDRAVLANAITPTKGGLLIAVHNTLKLTVHNEVRLSNDHRLNDPADVYSFYLCTDARDFEILSSSGFNVVLQARASGDDDGSLSRFAARSGFRYLNIETPRNQGEKQTRMLRWADEHLP